MKLKIYKSAKEIFVCFRIKNRRDLCRKNDKIVLEQPTETAKIRNKLLVQEVELVVKRIFLLSTTSTIYGKLKC
mgnify:CR=1 FL=1